MLLICVNKCLTFVCLLVFCAIAVNAQNTTSLSIELNNKTTLWNKELYGDFFTLNKTSTLEVNISSTNKNLLYIIFQAHSHLYNIILYNNSLVQGSFVNSTNVGLYSSAKVFDTFYIMNPNSVDLRIYISIHGYGIGDPIPGGCNMELPVPISPYLEVMYNNDYIVLNGAAAKQSTDKNCNKINEVSVTFYRLYLPERNFDEETYFQGLKTMLTYENIMENGDAIPETGMMWSMKRMLSAYPGTGSVYVAVATSSTGYSVYVPTYTYACDPLYEESGCVLLDDVFSQMVCAAFLFLGAFVCFFGHRFFKTEMFVVGMASGALVTFIVLSLISDLDRSALVGASVISGAMFGATWLLFWWFYGIPVLAVLLSTLNVGFLVAAIVYHGLPGGILILQLDFNFWTLFIFVMLLTSVLMISLTFFSNILCCSILGAYAIIFPIDYCTGSNLKYIMINTVRRATVDKFNYAVLAPPFEFTDALLTCVWVSLSLSGFLYQHHYSRGRPPFPPPPRAVSPAPPRGALYGALGRDGYNRQNQPLFAAQATPVVYGERSPLLA